MARFVLAVRETVIHQTVVSIVRGDRPGFGQLIVTDRRIALTRFTKQDDTPKGGGVFGFIGVALARLFFARGRDDVMLSDQIWRADFGEAEATGPGLLAVRSGGEGHGASGFEVAIPRPEAWAARLHNWSAGVLDVAPLPPARLVDRYVRRPAR